MPLAAASSSSALTLTQHTLNLQKKRRNHVANTQRPHLCRTTLMSGSSHSAQGVPCISMVRLDEGFPPARISNLRQALASRDIPCLTTLHFFLGRRLLCGATSFLGKADSWPLLPVLRFSFSCCAVLLRVIDVWVTVGPHAPWFCSRHYCFGLPTSVPVLRLCF